VKKKFKGSYCLDMGVMHLKHKWNTYK
jgi:hypothetical protein